MSTEDSKRVDYLKYVNTGLLTFILAVAVMIFDTVDKVKDKQDTQSIELIRLKTVQDINVANIDKLGTRVVALEYDRNSQIQNWVDDNYIRKPQKINMSSALFVVIVDTVLETVTIKDNGSDITNDPTSISIYFNGEDKLTSNAIVTKTIDDVNDINDFFNSNVGITYTYLELFGLDKPLDNFYVVQIVFDLGLNSEIVSNKVSISFTYQIAELIHKNVIGVRIPIEDLAESLRVGSMPQILEYLQSLSTNDVYLYDREVKWRKAYDYLNTIVNDLDY